MARLASITLRVPWTYSVLSLRPRWAQHRVGDNPDRIRPQAAVAQLWGIWPIAARPRRPSRHWLKRGSHRQASVVLDRIVIVRVRHHHRSRSSELTSRNPGRTRACATPEDDELPLVGECFVDLVDAVFGESVDDVEAAGSQVGVTLSVEAQEYGDESLADYSAVAHDIVVRRVG